jgi:hypothetical protein
MSHITVYGPWERIYIFGYACRQMMDRQASKVVLIGSWLIFHDVIVLCIILLGWLIHAFSPLQGLPILPMQWAFAGWSSAISAPSISSRASVAAAIAIGLPVLTAEVIVLYRTTRNYIVK